jgi:hypothetical protein
MTYAGVHRDVAFSVHCVNGAWRYSINKESFGQYTERDHAIRGAIQHIDGMLFEASLSRERWRSQLRQLTPAGGCGDGEGDELQICGIGKGGRARDRIAAEERSCAAGALEGNVRR